MARPRDKDRTEQPKDGKKTFKRLLSYMLAYKWKILLSFIMMILSSVGMVAMSYFIKPIVNDYIVPKNYKGMVGMLGIMLVVGVVTAIATYIYRKIMITASQNVTYTIRQEMFIHMEDLPVGFFDERSHGDLMSRFTNDVDSLNDALADGLLSLISSGITFIGNVAMMLFLNPQLFIISALTIGAMIWSAKRIGMAARGYYKEQQKYIGELNGYIEEMVSWTKVVKVFRYEDKAIERFGEKSERLRKAQTDAQKQSGSMFPTVGNIAYIGYALISLVGGLLTMRGTFDIGTLLAYLQYSRQLVGPVGNATENINMVFSALAGAERIFEILDTPPEVDQGDYELVYVEEVDGEIRECQEECRRWGWKNAHTGELVELKGEIEFKNVYFSYDGERDVLKDISFYAKPGQKLAFVGSTGAGKTTIMNLITRFYEADRGQILYDGIDIRDIRKSDLRKSFGMVLQNVNLFTGTIGENIKYANKNASEEEMIKAAELSNATSFICNLEHGYETEISGAAAELSEGERQLLSISRAALSDPPVLILDEATSSVDTRTERIIQRAMFNLMEGRTVLVIAHRLSTIYDSDAIFVMEDGRIVERGNHEELMDMKGRYYQLYTGAETLK